MGDLAWDEEPELIEGSFLVMTKCHVCRTAPAACIPEHVRDAKCLDCAMITNGATDRWDLTVRPRFAGPGSDSQAYGQIGSGAVPSTVERSEHPAPSVSSRERMAGTYPSAVLKVAERAREAGWEVRQQYARGCPVHGSTGRPLAEADSFALVFYGHPMTDAGAYAVYRGDSWKSINIAGMALGSVTDLAYWLSVGGAAEALWFQHIRALDEHAEYLKAQAPKAPAKKKAKESGG